MKTARRTPVRRPAYSTPNGESQLSSGEIDDSGTLSKMSRTKTAPAKSSRIATCPRVMNRWSLAEISVPITQIAVITTMITTAPIATATSFLKSGFGLPLFVSPPVSPRRS